MKKVLSLIVVVAIATAFVACGPSAEEKAKMEAQAKLTADSIAAALEASLKGAVDAAAAPVDSTAAAAETATAATEEKK